LRPAAVAVVVFLREAVFLRDAVLLRPAAAVALRDGVALRDVVFSFLVLRFRGAICFQSPPLRFRIQLNPYRQHCFNGARLFLNSSAGPDSDAATPSYHPGEGIYGNRLINKRL
jgi:hypothetical protein